jgi:carbohydrate kinase (thermoresistant glucokinase family)
MGVSGSGKTTVAALLAARLRWVFEEGDALHPASNVEKMRAGHPLTDADRDPWLRRIADWIDERLDAGEDGIVTCSALKRSYREVLARRGSGVVFVLLSGSREAIGHRLAERTGHFMPPSLLDSQLSTLEEPGADEPWLGVDIGAPPDAIADAILARLGLCAQGEPS